MVCAWTTILIVHRLSGTMKNILRLCCLALLVSCSTNRYVSFDVTQPAQISLPAEAKTILLVDRTKHANNAFNVIEGILTGEMPADDKVAAQHMLNSLMNSLSNSPRFNVKIHPERLTGNSMDASLPPALDWNRINQLCMSHQADIIVSLETFDSDFLVTKGTRQKKKIVGDKANKQEVAYTEYYAQGVGNVKMGIRAYFNKTKTIVDQQLINKSNNWEGSGTNPMEALAALISKSDANRRLARMVGDDYAYKISPMPIRISRKFFSKSKKVPAVEQGSRYADVAQWNEAIDVWKNAVSSANKKEAGKLAYNIAVGYEVIGEYGNALTWARDSYIKYSNKLGRSYVQNLQYRIDQERLLKEQMSSN